VAPSASLRKMSSTVMRVPRITGLPSITAGLISIRSVVMRDSCSIIARLLRERQAVAGLYIVVVGSRRSWGRAEARPLPRSAL